MLQKLHRRVFLDKMKREELTIYMSFYLQAANRDAFMAARQDVYLAFVAACRRHGAQLARNRFQVCANTKYNHGNNCETIRNSAIDHTCLLLKICMYLFTTLPHSHGHWQLQELLGNQIDNTL